ncbi:MAG: L-threonylcarbamoyladenylate synthase [Spirochaetaceae bacterium]|jgi:tRNA threonylcarbamoyl adenosine modification protein (Sua5/YciO/YrdC/YwlC family)|nr:L-threonylcarbamoyladenylate synthase [Spirochaetaceae bacterium]
MIEYVVPTNIDGRILAKGASLLAGGALLALPTDTSWSIVCSLTSREGVKRLRALSGEREERYFTLLCASISQCGEFCSIDNTRFRLIKQLAPGPYVFILKALLGTEKKLGLRRKEIGIRIPDHPLPLALITALGLPLYSITAKRSLESGGGGGAAAQDGDIPVILEEELFDEGWELEGVEGIDLILDSGEGRQRVFSSVLDLSGGEPRLLRAGAGPWPL